MINDAELADLRRDIEAVGPETATTAIVQRRTLAPDRSGGFSETWVDVHTYPCKFGPYPIRPDEREADVRVFSIRYWRFTFASGTDITTTDRLVVGTRTFQVTGAGEGTMSLQHEVIALEII